MIFNSYITFNGNCEEAIKRYQEIFGGEIIMMQKFSDAPASEDMPAEFGDRIMHAQLQVGSDVLMVSDNFEDKPIEYAGISVQAGFPTVEEARRVFDGLAEGGQITMPFEATFWSAGFGAVLDRFGISWLVNCDALPEQPE